MKLRAGDMVMIAWGDIAGSTSLGLTSSPFNPLHLESEIVSQLNVGETAIVISLSDSAGTNVYVIGPHGSGWTFGGYLKRVEP